MHIREMRSSWGVGAAAVVGAGSSVNTPVLNATESIGIYFLAVLQDFSADGRPGFPKIPAISDGVAPTES